MKRVVVMTFSCFQFPCVGSDWLHSHILLHIYFTSLAHTPTISLVPRCGGGGGGEGEKERLVHTVCACT